MNNNVEDFSNNLGIFSTSEYYDKSTIILEQILDTVYEYLDEENNFTSYGNSGNNYVEKIFDLIQVTKKQFVLNQRNRELLDDLEACEDKIIQLVLNAFSKEFMINRNELILDSFNNKETLSYATQVLFEKLYCERMELVGNFIYNYASTNHESIVNNYKAYINIKELAFQSLKVSEKLTKDQCVFVIAIKELIEDLLGDSEKISIKDFLLNANLNEDEIEILEAFSNETNNFLSILFNSVLKSHHIGILRTKLSNLFLEFAKNNISIPQEG